MDGWNSRRSRKIDSDTILEFGLGLTQLQKLAQGVRTAQALKVLVWPYL